MHEFRSLGREELLKINDKEIKTKYITVGNEAERTRETTFKKYKHIKTKIFDGNLKVGNKKQQDVKLEDITILCRTGEKII